MAAVMRGRPDMVKLLVKAKAYVNLMDTENNNALMLAAREGHHGIVKMLIKARSPLDESNVVRSFRA